MSSAALLPNHMLSKDLQHTPSSVNFSTDTELNGIYVLSVLPSVGGVSAVLGESASIVIPSFTVKEIANAQT